jgi:hypothetical protein
MPIDFGLKRPDKNAFSSVFKHHFELRTHFLAQFAIILTLLTYNGPSVDLLRTYDA